MTRASRRWEWLALIAVGLVIALAKYLYEPNLRASPDGSFYLNVARHVADGEGLATTVSLYRQGFQELPHASFVYPLWPILLGAGATILGLFHAARVVPEMLFALDLLLVFVLMHRISSWPASGRTLEQTRHASPWFMAVLATALVGTNHVFFQFSSRPYTEPLAMALTIAALLAVFRFGSDHRVRWAVVAGILASAAYLTRSQCIGVVLGVLGSFAIVGIRSPLARRGLVAAGVASMVTVMPWLAYVASGTDAFDPRMLFDFSAYRETDGLPPFEVLVATSGPLDYLLDRMSGLWVAFDPSSALSYVSSWGPAAYSLLLAGGVLAWRTARSPESPAARLTLRELPLIAVVLTGLATLLPVHLYHSVFVREWWFGHRYGLFLILLIMPSIAYLARAGRGLRRAGVAMVGLSIVWGSILVVGAVSLERVEPSSARVQLEAWLATQESKVFLTRHPQSLSLYTGAGMHWIQCEDSPSATRDMIRLLPIDFVISLPRDRMCPFLEELRNADPVVQFGKGRDQIFVYRAESHVTR